jgi:hypothetical protein
MPIPFGGMADTPDLPEFALLSRQINHAGHPVPIPPELHLVTSPGPKNARGGRRGQDIYLREFLQ